MRTIFLFFITLLLAGIVCAADYYVSPAGSGSTCTEASACALTYALSQAVAGDTIYCLDGTYQDTSATWEHAFNLARSGSAGKPITIKAANPLGAYFQRRNQNVPAIGIYSRDYVIIDGIKSDGIQFLGVDHGIIRNCEVTKGYIQGGDVSLHWGIDVQGSNHCLVQNNHVHDMLDEGNHLHNGAGLMLFGESDYNVIENNHVDTGNIVYNAYGTKGGGMDYNVWRYNIGENCVAGFMGMGNTADENHCTDNNVTQNIIKNCDYFLEENHGTLDWNIFNNVAYDISIFLMGQYYPDGSSVAPKRNNVWNNIIYTARDGYRRDPSSVDWGLFLSYADYNDFYGTTYIASYNWGSTHINPLSSWQSRGFDGNSLTVNPSFVDAGTDFHLQAGSPLIGEGRNGDNMGVYITGDETIGLLDESPEDTQGDEPVCEAAGSGSCYYASPTGTGNECSFENPCSLLAGSEKLVSPGGILYLREGTYDVSTYYPPNQNAAIHPHADDCTIAGYPGETAVIRGNSGSGAGVSPTGGTIGSFDGSTSYDGTTIRDLVIEGVVVMFGTGISLVDSDVSVGGDNWVGTLQGELVWVSNCYDCLIQNNRLHDNNVAFGDVGNSPLIMEYASSGVVIENNEIYNSVGRGVMLKDHPENMVVRYNYIHDNGRSCLWTANQAAANDVYVYQNIFENCDTLRSEEGGVTPCIRAYNIMVYNNLFLGSNTGEIAMGDGDSTFSVWNNIFYQPKSHFINLLYTGIDKIQYCDYNTYYGSGVWRINRENQNLDFNQWKSLCNCDSNSITSQPLFVDAASRDYHLQPGSPAIGAGIDRQDYDHDGNTAERINAGLYITGDEIIGLRDPDAQPSLPDEPAPVHAADTNEDGQLSVLEISAYINRWKIGQVSMSDLIDAIKIWKAQ